MILNQWVLSIFLTSSSSFCFCRSSKIICSSSSSSLSLSLSDEYSSVSLRPCCRLRKTSLDYTLNRVCSVRCASHYNTFHTQTSSAFSYLCMSAISARSLSISSFSVAICLRSTCSREISSSCSVRISFSWLWTKKKKLLMLVFQAFCWWERILNVCVVVFIWVTHLC